MTGAIFLWLILYLASLAYRYLTKRGRREWSPNRYRRSTKRKRKR